MSLRGRGFAWRQTLKRKKASWRIQLQRRPTLERRPQPRICHTVSMISMCTQGKGFTRRTRRKQRGAEGAPKLLRALIRSPRPPREAVPSFRICTKNWGRWYHSEEGAAQSCPSAPDPGRRPRNLAAAISWPVVGRGAADADGPVPRRNAWQCGEWIPRSAPGCRPHSRGRRGAFLGMTELRFACNPIGEKPERKGEDFYSWPWMKSIIILDRCGRRG
jgi:hypothetical protein